jgi:hypothetical protein
MVSLLDTNLIVVDPYHSTTYKKEGWLMLQSAGQYVCTVGFRLLVAAWGTLKK